MINVNQNSSTSINSYCISQSLHQTTDYFITSIKFLSLVSEIDLISLTYNMFTSLTVMSADSSQSSNMNIHFYDYLNEHYTESSTLHGEFSQFTELTVPASESESNSAHQFQQTTMLSISHNSTQSCQDATSQQHDMRLFQSTLMISTSHIQSLQSALSQQHLQSALNTQSCQSTTSLHILERMCQNSSHKVIKKLTTDVEFKTELRLDRSDEMNLNNVKDRSTYSHRHNNKIWHKNSETILMISRAKRESTVSQSKYNL